MSRAESTSSALRIARAADRRSRLRVSDEDVDRGDDGGEIGDGEEGMDECGLTGKSGGEMERLRNLLRRECLEVEGARQGCLLEDVLDEEVRRLGMVVTW